MNTVAVICDIKKLKNSAEMTNMFCFAITDNQILHEAVKNALKLTTH